ncbi:hypothetical protein CROQUDRAFT_93893 [Cronartium quercuum f. sp. fusiforme G11]|uniref:Protein kinase domain-containing protein n=1 Tax=Cronartium quercuum f. sp. fusiforme G11 TaxID=708437 RepID=A0A9P6TAN6_9BASI|nr:hypothetical protein CROQUDRAFT_93893 [Cronartium quercuum f. sp. fusiforme G11]
MYNGEFLLSLVFAKHQALNVDAPIFDGVNILEDILPKTDDDAVVYDWAEQRNSQQAFTKKDLLFDGEESNIDPEVIKAALEDELTTSPFHTQPQAQPQPRNHFPLPFSPPKPSLLYYYLPLSYVQTSSTSLTPIEPQITSVKRRSIQININTHPFTRFTNFDFLSTSSSPLKLFTSCCRMSSTTKMSLDDPNALVKVMACDGRSGEQREIGYTGTHVVGNGSFGVVFSARLVQGSVHPSGEEDVAIKKVLQDKRFKNRELQIMKLLSHPNVVDLRAYFYSTGDKPKRDEVFLNLVIEFVPETVYRASRHYSKLKQVMPMLNIKLYMYQLLRSLAYIHSLGICHRDIKPQNLLLNPITGILKLCDFGSAKILVAGEPNVSYICSRYYRAPELIFGATNYTTNIGRGKMIANLIIRTVFFIDHTHKLPTHILLFTAHIWSTGCVMAELMLGQPLFPGESGIDQLVEIIKVLGTPTREQIKTMNPNYMEHKFPQIKAHPFPKVFRPRTAHDAIALVSRLLEYTPSSRLTAIQAMCEPFFDELRLPDTKLTSGKPLPDLFNFTKTELSVQPDLITKLVPNHAIDELKSRGIDIHNFEPVPLPKFSLD